MKKIVQISVLFLFLTNLGCARNESSIRTESFITPPRHMNDGWTTGGLQEANIDSVRLLNLLRRINEKEYPGIDGVLIIRNGKLVFEEYFTGYDFEYTAKDFRGKRIRYNPRTIHNLASVTKSVTALIAGIAIDKGIISGVDEKIAGFFPQDTASFSGGKRKITLRYLLTMSSGLQWNEQDVSYGEMKNDIVRLFIVPDPLHYILSKPLAHEPGTKWYYNGGGTNLIGQIVQRTSGARLDKFAQKHLFDPLGTVQSKWVYINPDFVYASGDLRLLPRDMAKLGLLALNKGIWNGNRIVSPEWIEQMTKQHVTFPNDEGYGYQWWIQRYRLGSRVIDSYHAAGWGGQWIIVLPSLQAVVVITGSNYASKDPANEMMYNYLLPSMRKDFQYNFPAIENEAPLPDSINIVNPTNPKAPALAALSGRWLGQWDSHFLSCQLVIEKIEDHEAVIVYSWAAHPSGYFKNGWVRKKVRVDSTGRVKFETSDVLDFRPDLKEDVLIGNLKNAYVTSKAILRRKN